MGEEGIDFVTCRICGYQLNCRVSNHLRFCHKIGTEEYLKMYPDAPISSKKYVYAVAKKTEEQFRDQGQRDRLSEKRKLWAQDAEHRKLLSANAKECQNRPEMREVRRLKSLAYQNLPEVKARKSLLTIKRLRDPNDNWGRPKSGFHMVDSPRGRVKLRSSWELRLANYLLKLGVDWEYQYLSFQFMHDGVKHRYLPDFYIPSLKLFVEVHPYDSFDRYFLSRVESVSSEYDILVINEHNWGEILCEIEERLGGLLCCG